MMVEDYNKMGVSRHSRAVTHTKAQELQQQFQDVCNLKMDQISVCRGKACMDSHSSAKESSGCHHPPRDISTLKSDSMGTKESKERTQSLTGREAGWIWKELGGALNMIKIHCIKVSQN